MTQILYSPASPYSAKVRMAAHHAGIPFESVVVTTSAEPENLINANPLGKIPTLVTEDGKSVFDSRAIMQYLNRTSGNKLFRVMLKSAPMRNAMRQLQTACPMSCWLTFTSAARVLKKKCINHGLICNGARQNVHSIS